MKNQTTTDARGRVLKARIGSLDSNSSLEYLYALRAVVLEWLERIDIEILDRECAQIERLGAFKL